MRVGNGDVGIEPLAAVGKRVGRDVDDRHDQRPLAEHELTREERDENVAGHGRSRAAREQPSSEQTEQLYKDGRSGSSLLKLLPSDFASCLVASLIVAYSCVMAFPSAGTNGRSCVSRRGVSSAAGTGARRGAIFERQALREAADLIGVEHFAREQLVGDPQQHRPCAR